MGIWGPKLYQSDIAEEVRDYYRDQLRRKIWKRYYTRFDCAKQIYDTGF